MGEADALMGDGAAGRGIAEAACFAGFRQTFLCSGQADIWQARLQNQALEHPPQRRSFGGFAPHARHGGLDGRPSSVEALVRGGASASGAGDG